MWISDKWEDFEVLDAADGEKLERWGKVILRRPDPQVIWKERSFPQLWEKADALYRRSNTGGGAWQEMRKVPPRWTISYGKMVFHIKTMGFKHTGLFPEQAVNWDYIIEKIQKSGRQDIKVLNLFAYTGGATVAAASAGAQEVVHVDAAKGMVSWAKENIISSGLEQKKVRFIVDDVLKFVAREQRRQRKYDVIIMDPPSYGRGPGGEVWKLENELYGLLESCTQILSEQPLCMVVNSYTTGLSPAVVANMLGLTVAKKWGGSFQCEELALPIRGSKLVLPCGSTGRWSLND